MSDSRADAEARMPHLVVLTGAGISAESGLKTFRDGDGLWENHRVEDVATPHAWARDPETVLRFYDERRRQARLAEPNAAHRALAELASAGFCVSVITQNIDDLHERAGSRDVLHLHGELAMARSTADADLRYPVAQTIALGDLCDEGSQLRPDVVWFGEAVPRYAEACDIVAEADALLVVGTSLAVMPAALLLEQAPIGAPCWLVDPHAKALAPPGVSAIAEPASLGVPSLIARFMADGAFVTP